MQGHALLLTMTIIKGERILSDRANSFFRYLAYVIEIIVAFALSTTPHLLPEIFGAKPVLPVCVALTAAIFEREIPAMLIGMTAGILADISYTNSIGLFTITLTVVCFIVGHAANNLIMANFLNFLLYAAVTIGALFMLYYLVRFIIPGLDDGWLYFTRHLISRMVLTWICTIPFYFLNKLIQKRLNPEG